MTLNKTRRNLYRAARVVGDLQAAKQGPGAVVRRQARKSIWRAVARLLRGVGL